MYRVYMENLGPAGQEALIVVHHVRQVLPGGGEKGEEKGEKKREEKGEEKGEGKGIKRKCEKTHKNESFWGHDFFAAIFKQNIYSTN